MKKQILGIVLCLCMLFSLIVFALPAAADEATPITSAADYTALMNDSSMWGGSYILTADIDLDGVTLTPIGNSTTPFSGTFDGGGHTISGIEISGTDDVGLFGLVGAATIRNLTVSGSVTGTGECVGGIVGRVQTANITIENCVNRCTVSAGTDFAGGIVGRVALGAETALIRGCKNEGAVTAGNTYVGGIVGLSTNTSGATTIENCLNIGSVTATNSGAAGIVGYFRVYSGTAGKCAVRDCMNTGAITAGTGGYAGGIIAHGAGKNYAYTVTRCLNTGAVTASKAYYVRPIVGRPAAAAVSAGGISNCYYTSTDSYVSDTTDGGEVYVATPTLKASFSGFDFDSAPVWSMGAAGPELTLFHTHNTAVVTSNGDDTHTYFCTCGYEGVTEAHDFVNGVCTVCGAGCAHESTHDVITTAATCMSTGLKNVVCDDCEQVVYTNVEVPIDASNHVGTLYMDFNHGGTNAIDYCCNACNNVVIADTSSATDIYVATTGNTIAFGNVSAGNLLGTSANPFVNFTDAMQYAAYSATRRSGGVTLHIADSATTGSKYQTPACDYMITITGGTYNLGDRFIQSGPVTFEQIALRTTAQIVFAARCHKLVIGEGVTTNYAHYLLGGFEQSGGTVPASGYVTDVTVRSGTWHLVGGGNRYASASAVSGAKTTGSTHLVIGKTNGADTLEITSAIVGLSVNRSSAPELLTSATALIEFDGDFTATSAEFYPSSYSSSAVAGADYTVDVILRGTCGATTQTYCNTVTALTVYPDLSVDGTGDAADAMVGVYGGTVGSICEYYGTAHVDADTDNACDKCGYTVSFVFEPANVYAKILQNGRCYLRTIVTAHIPTGKTVEYFGISMVPLSYFTANSMTASDDEAENVAFFKSTAAIAEGDTFSADLKSIPYEERDTPIYAWVFVKYAESGDVAIYPLGTFTVSGSIYEG